MSGAIYSWGIDVGGLLGLRRIMRKHRIDHVVDLRLGRASTGNSRIDVARAVERRGVICSALPPAAAFTDARGGRRILVLGADPVPWAEPRHAEFLRPIAEDADRYRRSGIDWITEIEVGHLVGNEVLDPLKPPDEEGAAS